MSKPRHPIARIVIAAVLASLAAVCSAQTSHAEETLTVDELRECARMVKTLRQRSAAIHERLQQMDQRRAALARQRARMQQSDKNNQKAWAQYNEAAAAFNDDMARIRSDIRAINAVKRRYDRHCANQPYRDATLQKLPANLQEAMKAGLANVRVPYMGNPNAQP